MYTQGPFFDDDIGPQPCAERLFGDHLTSLLEERDKQISCSAAEPHWRFTFEQELLCREQAKWTELYPASLEEADAIQRAFHDIERTSGRGVIAGYKIGLTTPVMQKLCGVGSADIAQRFSALSHTSHSS